MIFNYAVGWLGVQISAIAFFVTIFYIVGPLISLVVSRQLGRVSAWRALWLNLPDNFTIWPVIFGTAAMLVNLERLKTPNHDGGVLILSMVLVVVSCYQGWNIMTAPIVGGSKPISARDDETIRSFRTLFAAIQERRAHRRNHPQ
jgi:hypothetical protein